MSVRRPSRRDFVRTSAAGTAVVLGATPLLSTPASAEARPVCSPSAPGGPVQITPDCDDPTYNRPVIDTEEDLTTPVRHRKVSGHFEGTSKKFTIYLPPKKQWQGRFFHKVYPTQDEQAPDDVVAFGAASGGYVVQTNGGIGYRVEAAAAKFSRTVAAKYYRSSRRIYGYLYGGSGGSYQTIGAIENTVGVWDGAVPFIPGSPVSIPNSFTVRALARLVLREKAARIADAVAPGGSGDPYAGLNSVERAMLREVSRMGVPLRTWEDYSYVLKLPVDPDNLLGFVAVVRNIDPTYADDFWSKPGYLGTEQSPLGDLVRAARIDHTATITEVRRDVDDVPTALLLDSVPATAIRTPLDFTVRGAHGTTNVGALKGSLDVAAKVFTLADGNSADVLDALAAGGRLQSDNRWFLAFHAYHRHQVPTRPGFHTFDQYRGPDGQPLYPQRAIQIGPLISVGTSDGGTHTGKVNGKVIVVANLLDCDACPVPGDWYGAQVKQAMGERFDDTYRLWYNDNADHLEGSATGARATRLVDWTGILEHALRDVSAWVEQGKAPARTTSYRMSDSQIAVPARARARLGVQPVVDLTVRGRDRIEVAAGRQVVFRARIEAPPKAGRIVSTEWDFTGSGNFTARPCGPARETVEVQAAFTYDKPGTYFVALRATAQREGDTHTPFARVRNLGRVRVVVR
ncbi:MULTISPECIES: PKD domain-containing protein [Streptomyces]|uniref:PKD domain-containing protein n=1 Tax=Streptomyces caniscabiei TaxID=2746961 RepID=A0ABU4MZJ6_9ACTN|nr:MULTISPECIES: PKD domain-containing protein [Streptomyces]MBE4740836.1 PKD domain-containing protein [Streptomyces caniscabiei]MBE4760610.1 PKD domain-containing protein [Streptomyces caniscabiei]MBE4774608.1 PKD domain-containing protein [Streptomyces caniscabiei]MBE4788971.1 PKD domain-containing protein [Streptomyces caniscabiei]MBE4798576.1 PKD domain-containing protein [Streptomyces caniscabiei]